MGQPIDKEHFSATDFAKFQKCVKEETELLGEWLHNNKFEQKEKKCGIELETCLINKQCQPTPQADRLLKAAKHPLMTEELALFNLEFNTTPETMDSHFLSRLQQQLVTTWKLAQQQANKLDANIISIGTLPTVTKSDLELTSLTPESRYRALNKQLMAKRYNHPLEFDIEGKQHLQAQFNNILVESAGTSIQAHLQLNPKTAHRYYNASLILSAPLIAATGNSPFLLGKDLWHETRIPIFESTVACSQPESNNSQYSRASFGYSYISSFYELFVNNMTIHPLLLPLVKKASTTDLYHLRLHNGTIWRWNRPIVSTENSDKPHLRLEHRVNAAAPSLVDNIANIALFIGAIEAFTEFDTPAEALLPFSTAKKNFYTAAQQGLQAKIKWLDGKIYTTKSLILNALLPYAKQGLSNLGVDKKEIDYYIDEIIKLRISKNATGTDWQRNYLKKHGCDMQTLTHAYLENQQQGRAIYSWRI